MTEMPKNKDEDKNNHTTGNTSLVGTGTSGSLIL